MAVDVNALRAFVADSLERARASGSLAPSDPLRAAARLAATGQAAGEERLLPRARSPLAASLDRLLGNFQSALADFAWPAGETWSSSRRALTDSPDASLRARLETGESRPFHRFVSQGFRETDSHDLDNRTYSLRLTHGGETETIDVAVTAEHRTWGDVLDAAVQAVNDAELPVQASLVRQSAANQRLEGLLSTGTHLALTLSPGHAASDLAVDRRDELTRVLDLEALPGKSPPAALRSWQATAPTRAAPSTWSSPVFDPGAPTGLTPGTHYLGLAIGDTDYSIPVAVEAGDAMGDLLAAAANAVNASQTDVLATTRDATRWAYVDGRRIQTVGRELTLQAATPKVGERLAITEGPAPDLVANFHNPSTGLPSPVDGVAYIASATANGWIADNVYRFDEGSNDWVETTPDEGDVAFLQEEDANWRFTSSGWSRDVPAVEVLGLDGTAISGSDGTLLADGPAQAYPQTSATGRFSLDGGRLEVQALESFQQRRTLDVVQGLEAVETQLGETVAAYNDLQRFLTRNASFVKEAAARSLSAPVAGRREALGGLGVAPARADAGELWIDGDALVAGLLADPAGSRRLLADGLIPDWRRAVSELRASPAESWLREAPPDPSPYPWRQHVQNDLNKRLLDRES